MGGRRGFAGDFLFSLLDIYSPEIFISFPARKITKVDQQCDDATYSLDGRVEPIGLSVCISSLVMFQHGVL
jgi:hypothetical protein